LGSLGDWFEGEWLMDMREGRGKYGFVGGEVYEGYFREDLMDGGGT
jgi:hypothetical protein